MVSVICLFLVGDKIYLHEQSQNVQLSQLSVLEGYIDYLDQRLQQVTNYYNVQPEYRDDAYYYLAIVNSLTLITSWRRGISATEPGGDYFERVQSNLLTSTVTPLPIASTSLLGSVCRIAVVYSTFLISF